MNCRSRVLQFGGVILGLFGMSAIAAPPIFSDNSRAHGNEAIASVCVQVPNRPVERCAYVHAWEHYDVKGTHQFTGIYINYRFHRSNPDGSWRFGQALMFCQTGLETIKASPNHVRIDAVLHPDGPECNSWGMIEECDPFGNCEPTEPWRFSDPTVVTGEWMDPIDSSKAVINRQHDFFDPWSETSHKTVEHCNENSGHVMARGGFSLEFGSFPPNPIRHFPFEGFDTQGWTHYWLRSCNNNSKVK